MTFDGSITESTPRWVGRRGAVSSRNNFEGRPGLSRAGVTVFPIVFSYRTGQRGDDNRLGMQEAEYLAKGTGGRRFIARMPVGAALREAIEFTDRGIVLTCDLSCSGGHSRAGRLEVKSVGPQGWSWSRQVDCGPEITKPGVAGQFWQVVLNTPGATVRIGCPAGSPGTSNAPEILESPG